MENYKLSPRKPDLLDYLDKLRKRRGNAYRAGDLIALEVVHQEMKVFWLRNGWGEYEAQAEYEIHIKECEVPYDSKVDELSNIKGKILLMAHS